MHVVASVMRTRERKFSAFATVSYLQFLVALPVVLFVVFFALLAVFFSDIVFTSLKYVRGISLPRLLCAGE